MSNLWDTAKIYVLTLGLFAGLAAVAFGLEYMLYWVAQWPYVLVGLVALYGVFVAAVTFWRR